MQIRREDRVVVGRSRRRGGEDTCACGVEFAGVCGWGGEEVGTAARGGGRV